MCQLVCPNLACRQMIQVSDDHRGNTVKCPYCSGAMRVPTARRGLISPTSMHDSSAGASFTPGRTANMPSNGRPR